MQLAWGVPVGTLELLEVRRSSQHLGLVARREKPAGGQTSWSYKTPSVARSNGALLRVSVGGSKRDAARRTKCPSRREILAITGRVLLEISRLPPEGMFRVTV